MGLALRSVDRIVPLVVLGLALLMGAGVSAIRLRAPRVGLVAGLACVALVAADLPPLWTGDLIASNLDSALAAARLRGRRRWRTSTPRERAAGCSDFPARTLRPTPGE